MNISKLLLIGIVLVSILFVAFGNDDGSAVESAKTEEETESVLQDVEVPTPTPEPTASSSFITDDSMTLPPTPPATPISKERPVILEIEVLPQVNQENLTVNITVDPNGNEIAGIQFDIKSDVQVNEIMLYNVNATFSSWEANDKGIITMIGFPISIFPTQKFTLASISYACTTSTCKIATIEKIIVVDKNGNIISAEYR